MARTLGAATALGVLAVLSASCHPRAAVDGERAHARVVHQVRVGPRIPGTATHDSVGRWIAAEVERLGGRVELQTFLDSTLGRPTPMTNVIGRFGPASGRRIALLAHWDSRPWSDRDPDSTRHAEPMPGANDGASGVAVLLEIAELMHQKAPAVGVELVFLDGEDLGTASNPDGYCRGSRIYAARARREDLLAGFVFDMIGDRDLSISPDLVSASNATNLVSLVLEAARATGAKHFLPTPKYDVFDDHVPLIQAGIPAVDVIDFDYPEWHTTRDLPDRVSAASLAEVAAVAAWIVYDSPLATRRP